VVHQDWVLFDREMIMAKKKIKKIVTKPFLGRQLHSSLTWMKSNSKRESASCLSRFS
jgi:hypothetical protein